MNKIKDKPLQPGDGVATLWTKPIRLKITGEARFLELCKVRYMMDLQGVEDPEAWAQLAQGFEDCGANHNAHAARQKARRFR